MTAQEIRLECLKLGHRVDRDAAEIVQRAEEFEKFILKQAVEDTPQVPKRKPGTLTSRS